MLVISVFVGKTKLNFHHKIMTKKMYGNLHEICESRVFKILEICKVFSNFNFNLTIREKIHLVAQFFRNKVIESFSLTSSIEHPN